MGLGKTHQQEINRGQGLYGAGGRGLRELGQQRRGADTAKEARL